MFIMSKHNYKVRRADGSFFDIKKDFVGEIPKRRLRMTSGRTQRKSPGMRRLKVQVREHAAMGNKHGRTIFFNGQGICS